MQWFEEVCSGSGTFKTVGNFEKDSGEDMGFMLIGFLLLSFNALNTRCISGLPAMPFENLII